MPTIRQATIHPPISLLDVGDSFFIPTLSVGTHLHRLRKQAAELGITIDYRMGIDTATQMYGIRIIRIT